jgi:acyl-CoA synthetase (AMP-forming)/AMP-acid ligase II
MSGELLRAWQEWRGSILCDHTGRRWPADELRRHADDLATALHAAGLREPDVVVLMAANTVGFPVALLACLQRGCCPLLLHAATPQPELDALLTSVGARWMLHDFVAGQSRIAASGAWRNVCQLGRLALGLRQTGSVAPPPALSEPATLLHATSGTYGRPQLCDRPQRTAVAEAKNYVETLALFAGAHVVATTPLHHAFAFGFGLVSSLLASSCLELRPGFHPVRTLRSELPDADILAVVPPMLPLLTRLRAGQAMRKVRHTFFAGAPCHETIAAAFAKVFAQPVYQIYGTTETGGIASSYGAGGPRPGAGQPLRGVTVSIADAGGFPELGPDVGEICVRSPSMMAGYLGAAMAGPTWHTGDLGRVLAAGDVELLGRLRDIINVGGSKVDPREVEEILHRHRAVADAAVYAGQRADGSELVQAAITPRDAAPAGELRRFCEQHLASHKVPQVIHFVDVIPRTPSGKCRRNELPEAAPGRRPDGRGPRV